MFDASTPFRLRRLDLFERGGDPRKIQHLLAHADISTTMLYTEVVADDLAATAQLLEGPAHTGRPYAQPGEGAT